MLAVTFSFLPSLGCTGPYKALTRRELTTIASLTVVRYPTPTMTVETSERMGLAVAAILLTGGVGALAAAPFVGEKRETPVDFGHLILQAFTQRVPQEIPEWPTMNFIEGPIEESSMPTGPILALRVNLFNFNDHLGLETVATIEMVRADREVIWRKWFRYYSRTYDRVRTSDEFMANDNKLLKEEVRFAADRMADVFIEDLKASK